MMNSHRHAERPWWPSSFVVLAPINPPKAFPSSWPMKNMANRFPISALVYLESQHRPRNSSPCAQVVDHTREEDCLCSAEKDSHSEKSLVRLNGGRATADETPDGYGRANV